MEVSDSLELPGHSALDQLVSAARPVQKACKASGGLPMVHGTEKAYF